MSKLPATIPKRPARKPAEDYYRLRREGIGFIEKMGSRLWTDFNTHDPGISILEASCYAITDIAYRTGWDIKDILVSNTSSTEQSCPYPNQAFFTARRILTINPVTPSDFRRVLIDINSVRNAWVFCKECPCEPTYYAWCEKETLLLSYEPGDGAPTPKLVSPRGLYEALLDLEAVPELGDLNDRKIEHTFVVTDADGDHPVLVEIRFPEVRPENAERWQLFLDEGPDSTDSPGFSVQLGRLGAQKSFDIFTEIQDKDEQDDYLRKHWRKLWYLDFAVTFTYTEPSTPATEVTASFIIKNATMRLFSDAAAKKDVTAEGLKALFDIKKAGSIIVSNYRKKAKAAAAVVEEAKGTLHDRRNLDEDFCRVDVVGIEEVAVCADVEVQPDADIERVQAKIFFEIERYFNPPIPFYTLQELRDSGEEPEDIFNGPALKNGFIKTTDLEAASLKAVLCASDIINRLMDIDGVIAVTNLQLTKYDAEGNIVRGAADPSFEGGTIFDKNKISASWLMYLRERHRPRLYLSASRFLFFKNGLLFAPRVDEVHDILTQLRGEVERPKIVKGSAGDPEDLAVPAGKYRNTQDYYPVQYSFPLTYGTGPEGLPSHVSEKRRAQTKQLKAYLMAFEQLLGNALAQIANTANLFSLDSGVTRTYFVREFSEEVIRGYDEIVKDLDKSTLEALTETPQESRKRRNRFLDHLMARFGEQFREYALLLAELEGEQGALDTLIKSKISFLNAYPEMSAARAKAFNYRNNPCSPDNVPGLKKRIGLLLGRPDLKFIVVEHLLLRPKFAGDALYPACADGACETCGEEDPYSFRLTFVMAGWTTPFDTNMHMRSFADRTIRRETPSHLLGKICWVGNEGLSEKPCEPTIDELAELIEKKGLTAEGKRPARADACDCAAKIYVAFGEVFSQWFEDKTLDYIHPEALRTALDTVFSTKVDSSGVTCAIVWETELWSDIQAIMIGHFHHVALFGYQFDRFETAWGKWLEANAKYDWAKERLQESVEAILEDNVIPGAEAGQVKRDKVCKCASDILAHYGKAFYDWMDGNFKAHTPLEDFLTFQGFPYPSVTTCPDNFNADAAVQIGNLLESRYKEYVEVSYRLWVVVNLLSKLTNIYPAATLHDWDEGGDANPVRLGKTALGS